MIGMKDPMKNQQLIRRARRLMTAGLLLSVMGNRLVEGGYDGLAAAGFIGASAVVAVSTLGQLTVLLFPLYARILRNWSPNTALIAGDCSEMVLGGIAIAGMLAIPEGIHLWVLGYVVLDLLIAPATDIAEEFYGSGLAALSDGDALAFNANLNSMLAFLGFVILAPLGARLAGVSLPWLMVGNVILSGISVASRTRSRQMLALPAPGDEVDSADYSMLGQRTPLRQFVQDLLRSGPASPLMSLFIQIAGGLTGELLMLWAASLGASSGFESMSIVLLVFGLAATAGPQLGRWLAQRSSSQYVINISALASLSLLLALALGVWRGWVSFPIALAVIFCNALVGRARLTVLSTHRQVWFSGRRFERIMSWSYAFGGFGTIIGLQLGYLLGVTTDPLYALIAAALIWAVIATVRFAPTQTPEEAKAWEG